jgi:hypothetical protein
MSRYLPLIVALAAGCGGTAPPDPAAVRAADLARSYRDDPDLASRAYDGRPVRLALTNPQRVGGELRWHVGHPDRPAVVVCRFDGPAPDPAPVVWVVGTCRGRVPDGAARELTGYDFYVLVTDCRPADPPTTPRP